MDIEEVKANIRNQVEKYHQDHWQALYPAGQGIKDWGLQAVAENVVMPLYAEIDRLKKLVPQEPNTAKST